MSVISVIDLLKNYHEQIESAFLDGRKSPYQLNRAIWALVAEMSRQLAMNPSCTWRLDDDGYYATQCGQAYTAFDGGLETHHYRYCPACGRSIVEAHDAEEQSEDE